MDSYSGGYMDRGSMDLRYVLLLGVGLLVCVGCVVLLVCAVVVGECCWFSGWLVVLRVFGLPTLGMAWIGRGEAWEEWIGAVWIAEEVEAWIVEVWYRSTSFSIWPKYEFSALENSYLGQIEIDCFFKKITIFFRN